MLAVVAVAALASVLALWLFTFDVHVGLGRYGEPGPSFCGSAYDVALLKHDGYMGGEYSGNQAALDRACVAKANLLMVGAGVAGLIAAGAGVLAMRVFTRRGSHPRVALAVLVVAIGVVPVVLGISAVRLLSGPHLDELVVPEDETAGAITKPSTEEKANFSLWVSNQSFSPETVHIDVQLDGVIVVHQDFAVGSQHNWVNFPLWLSPGKHELIVVSDTGIKLAKYFTMPDEKRYAIVDYWGDRDEGGKRFDCRIQSEPAVFA